MKQAIKAGKAALALALLCSACTNGTSPLPPLGGSGGKGGQGGGQGGAQGGSGGASTTPGKCDNATNVTACGGDVVGSWDVSSSCLKLSGDFNSRGTGMGCDTFKVTGAAQVTGSFAMTADKKFKDNTTTTGDVTITLDHQCLWMSGSWTTCDLISVGVEGLGFTDVHCADASGGGCNCPGKINQKGTMGLIVATPADSGSYTSKDNTITSDDPNPLTGADIAYSYCIANGTLTVTPKSSSPTVTGTIVLKKASGGSGGAGGSGAGGSGGSGGAGAGGGGSGSGGSTGKGGSTGSGGSTGNGGGAGSGGSTGNGGSTDATGGSANGGSTGSGGGGAVGGSTGTGGGTGTTPGSGPCDILENAKTPCVAAYSMVRPIYSAYKGPLYQVRSKSDKNSVKDVPIADHGFADSKVQDDFCSANGCTVSKIYDQSPKKNDLALSPDTFWLVLNGTPKSGGGLNQKEADVKNNPKINISGHPVYGLKFMPGGGNAYRVLKPNGTAAGDDPEYIYAIFDTTVYNGQCCNDFGNAETTGNPDSFTSMEAIYYGNATMWGKGGGNGPWFSCDYEAVISPGSAKVDTSIPSITGIKQFATFILKGYSGGKLALKYGDAQAGELKTQYDGARADGAKTMKKQGSIILGTGGDGSAWSTGVWFEGAMTAGCSSDKAVDDAIQANIVAAGFGK
jgi:hypothetical protein